MSRFDFLADQKGAGTGEGSTCPACGRPARIERVRQEIDPPFVEPGGPIVRRATCAAGHITWMDDAEGRR